MICVNNYWDIHYINGGKSSDSNIDTAREWKMGILQKYGLHYNTSIIDIGCGDMDFWNNFPLKDYTGVDISPTIIKQNHIKYPNYKLYCSNSSNLLKISANYVICFDMLFHIMNTTEYIMTLTNLEYYTKQKLFIYTWIKNPFESFKNRLILKKPFEKNIITDGKYQYYRNFDSYSIRYIEPYLKLIDICTDNRWPYGAMYIYDRERHH
jgi:hypothetical protein